MRSRARRLLAAGGLAASAAILAAGLVAQVPQNRTIALRNIHTDDVVTVEYKRGGRFVPEAMERINWVMRDWRRNEQTRMDPALIDLLWEMHRELGSKEPINVISAYRSRTTNNMLRRSVGGQASESRHILGKAADVQFPDVPVKHVRYAAMVRERGGVGYYPTSATPFVHVDTDRVRAWPRMPRFELALLFPNGRTQHKPAEGGDITADDVRTARARQPAVAVQLAQFHDMRRRTPQQPTLMTALAPGLDEVVLTPGPSLTRAPPPPAPRLVTEPRIADRPARLTRRPSEEDRRTLTQLVALAAIPTLIAGPAPAVRPPLPAPVPKRKGADHDGPDGADAAADAAAATASPFPRLAFLSPTGIEALKGWSTGFVAAPAWDEDHPEEAAYRPFPLAPFLTETASIDDPALARLVHPDLAGTAALFETADGTQPMRLLPGRNLARLMWSEVDPAGTIDAARPVAERRVRSEATR